MPCWHICVTDWIYTLYSGGQSEESMKKPSHYLLMSSEMGDEQDRKRPLAISEKDRIGECYSHIQTYAESYNRLEFSQRDLEKSMQNFPYKRNKLTTEERALSTDIQFSQSTRHILSEIRTDKARNCSKQQLSEKTCFINCNNGVVEEFKVQPSNVDSVIDMLHSKMQSIYNSDLSAIKARVIKNKLDSLANDVEHSHEIDAKGGHFISKCGPISSNFGEDPILALSYRMRSILLQSPNLVPY